jgi:ubiquinone/menaquinone biosynthesis C-methylase UbiE
VNSGSFALGYDTIARHYDAQVAGDQWMRTVLHAHYARLFRAGDRVLDVGCGTGIDAIALASRGVRVIGIDASAGMLAQLRAKVEAAGLQHLVETCELRIEDLSCLQPAAPVDGLISAFASLNTLPELTMFAQQAVRLVRPHGRMVLHLLNRFSSWEWLGAVSRLRLGQAVQVGRHDSRSFTIGGQAVTHRLYYACEAYARYFANDFALAARYGLGAIRPPHTVRRLPRGVVQQLERLDLVAGAWPLVRDAGRFWVLDLERLPA